MNKSQLVDAMVEKTGWSRREAETAVQVFLDTVTDTVAGGERVTIPGFGTFEKRARAARTARNPQTGEPVKIKKTNVPAFKAGTGFKAYVAMSKRDQAAYKRERG